MHAHTPLALLRASHFILRRLPSPQRYPFRRSRTRQGKNTRMRVDRSVPLYHNKEEHSPLPGLPSTEKGTTPYAKNHIVGFIFCCSSCLLGKVTCVSRSGEVDLQCSLVTLLSCTGTAPIERDSKTLEVAVLSLNCPLLYLPTEPPSVP